MALLVLSYANNNGERLFCSGLRSKISGHSSPVRVRLNYLAVLGFNKPDSFYPVEKERLVRMY